ncbi:MAG: hypothetical protein BroJett024_26130 [Alphaproteobacteria bacterium]|nr:MAG: hypothetical protein BroJett024_26130 [Alphaproteobacteria bacterium]
MSALDHLDLPEDAPRLRRFTVLGAAEPGLLSRLIEPFAKRGLVPRRVVAEAEEGALRVSLAAELDAATAALIAAGLRATVGVAAVLAEQG